MHGAQDHLASFWQFLRPHTIHGTVLATLAITARAILDHPGSVGPHILRTAPLSLLCVLAGNGYIVGINQICDLEIDRINKPWLPVAAGRISIANGALYCAALGTLGLLGAWTTLDPLIASLYTIGLAIGTAYSAPPFRLKRNPVAAMLCIAIVRGVLLNFGLYHAITSALGQPFGWRRPAMYDHSSWDWG